VKEFDVVARVDTPEDVEYIPPRRRAAVRAAGVAARVARRVPKRRINHVKPLKGFTLPTGIRREKAELPVENRSIVIVNETADNTTTFFMA